MSRSCLIPGCDGRVVASGLCSKHDARRRSGRPLVEPWETDPELGILPRGDDWVMCLECGRAMRNLGSHLNLVHHMTGMEFRAAHELAAGEPLACDMVRRRNGEKARERVGSPDWRRFEAARDAKLPESQKLASEASRNMTQGGRRLKSVHTEGRPRERRCPECGRLLEPGRKVCSSECAKRSKTRAAWHRSADRAGEPWNFTRSPGSGPRITSDNIREECGVSWALWRHRVKAGTAPLHDGREDGRRWWWKSTVTHVVGGFRH